ncbi:MAG: tetratricopeptide repeat protein [Bacteroidia bacterium]
MKKTLYIAFLLTLTSVFKGQTAKEYEELGDKYFTAAKHKKAVKSFEKAIKLDSKNPDLYIKLAEATYYAGNFRDKDFIKVIEIYNKAFEVRPNYIPAYLSRASYHQQMSEYQYALRDLNDVLGIADTCTDAYLLKGQIYYDKKDTANGNQTYRMALKKISSNRFWEIYHDKAWYEFKLDLFDICVADYLMELKLIGGVRFFSYCELSWAYLQINKSDSACFYYDLCNQERGMNHKIDKNLMDKTCPRK